MKQVNFLYGTNAPELAPGSLYFVVIGLVLAGNLSVWLLLVLFSIPLLITTLKRYSAPKPAEYADSPLYYVGLAFYFTRQAGFLFIAGLIMNLLVPISLPLKLF